MKISNITIYSIIKFILQLGILILFVNIFLKLFLSIPSNLIIKFIFILTYIWFTIGINVNLVMPLLGIIDKKINKNKT